MTGIAEKKEEAEREMETHSPRHQKVSAGTSVLILFLLAAAACAKPQPTAQAMSAPSVEVVEVEQRDMPVYSEWIGTLDGFVNAEIKAQVAGYLLKQYYLEGSFVRKGQLLFEIDPRTFQAALDQAKGKVSEARGQLAQTNGQLLQARAQLAQTEADQGKAQLDVNRYTPLAKERAITDQELDNAIQFNISAKAKVEAAKAAVETAKASIEAAKAAVESAQAGVATAQLNLGFTKITSPIDGIAGIARAQIGNLVNPSSDPLTTISTVNPIKVYFTPSEQEYLIFVRRNPTQSLRDAANRQLRLELILSDGTVYPEPGRFFMADREVDQKTGAIRLAGLFPNPGNILRPGQYGRIRTATTTIVGALLVPQRAVSELQGRYQVAVVGPDNKVSLRPVKVGERSNSMWIIAEGLQPGERVVAEGTQKVRPGLVVTPKPYVPPSPTPAP
jgi:membrane fusion protein (multidrug efflux system)